MVLVYRDLWVRGWHCRYLFGVITSAAYTSNMVVVRRMKDEEVDIGG